MNYRSHHNCDSKLSTVQFRQQVVHRNFIMAGIHDAGLFCLGLLRFSSDALRCASDPINPLNLTYFPLGGVRMFYADLNPSPAPFFVLPSRP